MKIKKEYLVLGVIIAALAIYLYQRSTDRTHYTLPALPALTAADITRIQIAGLGKTQTLVRKENRWITEPQGFTADPKRVNDMLETLTGLNLTALVAESKNYDLYELDPENKVSVKAWQGDQVKRDLDIGKTAPSFRHTFVKLAGDDRVFHAADNFRSRFQSGLDDIRDRTVLSFTRQDLQEIRISKGATAATFTRPAIQTEATPSGQPTPPPIGWQSSDGRPANTGDVDMLIGELTGLQCQAFIDDRGKDSFNSPVYSIVLKASKEHSLSIFAPAETDGPYPAVSSDSDHPFQLSADQAQRIMKDPDEYFKKGEKEENR